jgi:hypothetical protein
MTFLGMLSMILNLIKYSIQINKHLKIIKLNYSKEINITKKNNFLTDYHK